MLMATENKASATVSLQSDVLDEAFEFDVHHGTIGPSVFDIRKLYGQTGMFTYDPAFMSTASCESKITYIDGEKG